MSSTYSTLVEGSVAWINEKPNYHGQNIPDGNFSSYGHYTQVGQDRDWMKPIDSI